MAREKTQRIIVPYRPRGQFSGFHERTQRFAAIVAHRRAGKTVACVNDLIKRAVTCPRESGRFAYIAPLFTQAKDVAWAYVKDYAAPLVAGQPHESELRLDLINGARIRLYGADNPDRLRGLYLDGCVLDEFADMHPGVWGEVIRPALADRKGGATFIGTPRGRNQFFQVWERARRDPEWFSLMLRASETDILARDELEAARRDMTPEQYSQEFECSFDAAIVGAYFAREIADAEREGRIGRVGIDPELPVHTAWDLGIGDSTAIWFWQVAGPEIRVVDFYESHGQRLEHYAKAIFAKDYPRGHDHVPHDARVKEFIAGRTRVEAMAGLGLTPTLVPDHKLMDGINAVRLTLPRVVFDEERCAHGLECLRQYRTEYDAQARAFRDAPKHDWTSHAADAFRYLCMAWREMAPRPKPPEDPGRAFARKPTFDEVHAAMDRARKGLGGRI